MRRWRWGRGPGREAVRRRRWGRGPVRKIVRRRSWRRRARISHRLGRGHWRGGSRGVRVRRRRGRRGPVKGAAGAGRGGRSSAVSAAAGRGGRGCPVRATTTTTTSTITTTAAGRGGRRGPRRPLRRPLAARGLRRRRHGRGLPRQRARVERLGLLGRGVVRGLGVGLEGLPPRLGLGRRVLGARRVAGQGAHGPAGGAEGVWQHLDEVAREHAHGAPVAEEPPRPPRPVARVEALDQVALYEAQVAFRLPPALASLCQCLGAQGRLIPLLPTSTPPCTSTGTAPVAAALLVTWLGVSLVGVGNFVRLRGRGNPRATQVGVVVGEAPRLISALPCEL